jgi:uncharacterized protein YukJ
MPLARYGVLAGQVVDRRAEGGTDTPHYQIQVDGGGVDFRVAVNVLSKQHPSELLYLADETFQHPIVQNLATLPDRFAPLPSTPGGLSSTISWRGLRPTQRRGCTPWTLVFYRLIF